MHVLANVGVCVSEREGEGGGGRAKPQDNVQEPQLLKDKRSPEADWNLPSIGSLAKSHLTRFQGFIELFAHWAKPTHRVMRLWPSVHAVVLNNSDNRFITGKRWIILLCTASRWQFYDLLCPLRF